MQTFRKSTVHNVQFTILARSANLPKGLYILPMFFFFIFHICFLMVDIPDRIS